MNSQHHPLPTRSHSWALADLHGAVDQGGPDDDSLFGQASRLSGVSSSRRMRRVLWQSPRRNDQPALFQFAAASIDRFEGGPDQQLVGQILLGYARRANRLTRMSI